MDRQTSGKVDGNNNEQKGDCAEKSTYFNAFKSICSAVGRLLKYFSIRTKKGYGFRKQIPARKDKALAESTIFSRALKT